MVRCKVFNVVVAVLFPDISSVNVGFFPWSLSSKEWLPLAQHSQGGWVPTFHNAFSRKLGSSGTTTSLLLSFLILGSLTPKLIKPFDHPRAPICHRAQPTTQHSCSAHLSSQVSHLFFYYSIFATYTSLILGTFKKYVYKNI